MTGHVTRDDLFPVQFSEIANGGGGQLRHVLLTAVWTGLAEAAMEEAHKAVRAAARRDIGTTPQSAMRLAEILADVQAARSTLAEAQRQVEARIECDKLEDIGLIMSLRNVKVVTSTAAMHAATAALQICGINGFRRGPEHRLERIIRDACGALIMVSNDRYLHENAEMLPVRKTSDRICSAHRSRSSRYVYDPLSFAPLSITQAAEGSAAWSAWSTSRSRTPRPPRGSCASSGRSSTRRTAMSSSVAAALREHEPDGVLSMHDSDLVWTAKLAELLQLPFHSRETALKLTDNIAQRDALAVAGLAVPMYRIIAADADAAASPRSPPASPTRPC